MSAQQVTLDGDTIDLSDDRFKKSLSGVALVLWEVDDLDAAYELCVERELFDRGGGE